MLLTKAGVQSACARGCRGWSNVFGAARVLQLHWESLEGDSMCCGASDRPKHDALPSVGPGLWLSLGGFQEQVPADDTVVAGASGDASSEASNEMTNKVYNSHVIISGTGKIEATYRKIHLFDVDIPGGAVMKESRYTQAGSEMVVCRGTPVGEAGVTTCYDLRFPEMYCCLAEKGAQVLLVPSAFTIPTGKAHWEVLLRARAIETQSYVIASAQVGQHNEKRASYGHSLIVDPWGRVLADAGGQDSPCIRTADIDLSELAALRQKMPIGDHRRAAGPMFAEQLLEDVFGRKSAL